MKPNRFKQLLADGKSPVGHMLIEFNTRGMAQILDVAGVDFAVIDMEHGSFTIDDVANMVAWMAATPVAPFVRIPQVQYSFIARALDVGALGVVAPNVQSAAEARALVEAAKYPPLGKRGLHSGGASSGFRPVDPRDHIERANENTTVICMIESPEGVDCVEEIAATPRLDALWVGHWDLTQYMGITGQFRARPFLDAVKRIIDAAHEQRLVTVIQPGNMTQLREFCELGFDVISYGGDFILYREALTQAVTDVREIMGDRE